MQLRAKANPRILQEMLHLPFFNNSCVILFGYTDVFSRPGKIESLNNMRSDMGAYINRLDHAITNIANQHYNTQDAESRIRDVDFATETTEFTKSQILQQSSMAMLSQANAVPQSVLQLLG